MSHLYETLSSSFITYLTHVIRCVGLLRFNLFEAVEKSVIYCIGAQKKLERLLSPGNKGDTISVVRGYAGQDAARALHGS